MEKMMKELFIALFCAVFAFMLITPLSGNRINSMSFLISSQYIAKQYENERQEDEAINTYYVDTGSYNGTDFSTAAIYEFDTRTGEWSDGGNYVIHSGNLCEVNKYGERTKIGQIITWN